MIFFKKICLVLWLAPRILRSWRSRERHAQTRENQIWSSDHANYGRRSATNALCIEAKPRAHAPRAKHLNFARHEDSETAPLPSAYQRERRRAPGQHTSCALARRDNKLYRCACVKLGCSTRMLDDIVGTAAPVSLRTRLRAPASINQSPPASR